MNTLPPIKRGDSHMASHRAVDLPRYLERPGRYFIWILVGLVASLAILPWQQTSFGTGRVVAWVPGDRSQSIDTPVDGRVAHWHVLEGARVNKGDRLVDVSDIDPKVLDRLRTELSAAEARARATDQALKSSQNNWVRQKELFEQGLSSRRVFELAEIELSRLKADQASAQAELAKVETRLARQGAQTVLAPRAGVLQKIRVPEGGPVFKAGDSLGILIPDAEDRAAEVWVSGNDIPLIFPGRLVRLQFEGWPAVQFVGWPSVAVGTFAGRVQFVDPIDDGDGKFRVLIQPVSGEPWPSNQYLRQGVRANAWILLDTVRVGYELWRQFNGFPPSRDKPPQEQKK